MSRHSKKRTGKSDSKSHLFAITPIPLPTKMHIFTFSSSSSTTATPSLKTPPSPLPPPATAVKSPSTLPKAPTTSSVMTTASSFAPASRPCLSARAICVRFVIAFTTPRFFVARRGGSVLTNVQRGSLRRQVFGAHGYAGDRIETNLGFAEEQRVKWCRCMPSP